MFSTPPAVSVVAFSYGIHRIAIYQKAKRIHNNLWLHYGNPCGELGRGGVEECIVVGGFYSDGDVDLTAKGRLFVR